MKQCIVSTKTNWKVCRCTQSILCIASRASSVAYRERPPPRIYKQAKSATRTESHVGLAYAHDALGSHLKCSKLCVCRLASCGRQRKMVCWLMTRQLRYEECARVSIRIHNLLNEHASNVNQHRTDTTIASWKHRDDGKWRVNFDGHYYRKCHSRNGFVYLKN